VIKSFHLQFYPSKHLFDIRTNNFTFYNLTQLTVKHTRNTDFRTPHHNTSNQVESPVPPTCIHHLSGHAARHGQVYGHIHTYNRPSTVSSDDSSHHPGQWPS